MICDSQGSWGSVLVYLIFDGLPVPGDNRPKLRSLAAFSSLDIDEREMRTLR